MIDKAILDEVLPVPELETLKEEKIAELQTFIARFAANKAKSKQATSRRRLLDKMSVEEMPASSRRYPFVGFEREREVGKDILFVTDVSKTIDGVKLLDKVSFIVNKNDKIAFVGENELAQTTLFKILMGELEPDEGSVKWGQTVTTSYLPKDNTEYFEGCTDSLVDWIRQFSSKKDDVYLRGFLGRMLFSGEEVFKPVNVLSGGEKVRCMLSRMMLSGANVLLLDQPTIWTWRPSRPSTRACAPSRAISCSPRTTMSCCRPPATASSSSSPTAPSSTV